MKATGMKGCFCGVSYFFCSRDNAECFFLFVALRDRQGDEETCVDGVETCGDS